MPLEERALAFVLIALAVLTAAALVRRAAPGRVMAGGAVLAVALDVVWLGHHNAYEGPVVVALTDEHGLAIADLGVPPSLLLAASVLFRHARETDRS